MADIAVFRQYTNTAARRRTFYCYCTKEFVQDQAVFFVLVEAYRVSRRKRQAVFLNDWFINGNIPATLQDGGYLGIVNISEEMKKKVSNSTNDAVAAVGRSFSDKMANQGGGVGGFFGALGKKITGGTGVPANLFDGPQGQVATMLDEGGKHGFGGKNGAGATYRPDGAYQPLGAFAAQAQTFKAHLKTAGFNPDDLGIF